MNPYPYDPPQPPAMPPEPPQKTPTRAIVAFIVALLAFIGGIVPLVGLIGGVGVVLGVLERGMPDPRHPRGLATAAVVLGSFAVLGAFAWMAFGTYVVMTSSCPHVYAFDGDTFTLDGDMASGALFAGAEKNDLDRLEHLRAVDGVYRVRVQNDLEEIDHINSFALLVVDHAPSDEVLPTPDGELVVVRGAALPSERAFSESERDVWSLTFERPAGDQALLVVRGNNTDFAEQSFMHYMAGMGHGVGPLFAWMIDDDCPCSRTYLDEEIDRLGLPLEVDVLAAGGSSHQRVKLGPVGPAVMRSQALRVKLPPGGAGDPITIRLAGTTSFWSVSEVRLAPLTESAVEPTRIAPRRATLASVDVTAELSARDDQRVVLHTGDRIDVELDAPPPSHGKTRTVVVSLDGYYEVEFGGRAGINPAAVIAHQAGWTSLPDFARENARP